MGFGYQRVATVASTKPGESDLVLVGPGEIIPVHGRIVRGVAIVEEAAITGVSHPAVREAGNDRSEVIEGTHVLSGSILIRPRLDS